MTLYALDDIDDAIDTTRSFLWPFDLGRWLKLAVVVFFLGGTGGTSPMQFTGEFSGEPMPGGPEMGLPETLPSLSSSELAIVVGVFAVGLLIALGFMLISAIMEFVFVESLRREAVTIRRYWNDRWKQGVRLFGFRVGIGLLTLLVVGGVLAVAFTPAMLGTGEVSFALLVLAAPVFIVLALVSALVNGFTTALVVPVMIVEDRPLLSAWRRFWPTLTGQWKEYVVFAVMRFILQIAAGILVGIVTLLAAVIVAIPLGVVAAVGVGLLSVVEVAGVAVIAFAAGLFLLAVLVFALLAAVPVQTVLHYYALLVLGDTNDDFDLIPDQRDAVREEPA
ncbi:MAG: hypothetical protein V5A38_11005 [Halolamina sp.]|uniref:DUF7544 domain-containing protein n=1 Tax=Halolamina sp. TaxID=1940283 RepID=UPI002FC33588